MHDLRTEKEIERDKTHDRICHEFSTLVAEHPKAAPHRIAAAVGEMVGMTAPGVIKVLTKRGLYQPKSRAANATQQ